MLTNIMLYFNVTMILTYSTGHPNGFSCHRVPMCDTNGLFDNMLLVVLK